MMDDSRVRMIEQGGPRARASAARGQPSSADDRRDRRAGPSRPPGGRERAEGGAPARERRDERHAHELPVGDEARARRRRGAAPAADDAEDGRHDQREREERAGAEDSLPLPRHDLPGPAQASPSRRAALPPRMRSLASALSGSARSPSTLPFMVGTLGQSEPNSTLSLTRSRSGEGGG